MVPSVYTLSLRMPLCNLVLGLVLSCCEGGASTASVTVAEASTADPCAASAEDPCGTEDPCAAGAETGGDASPRRCWRRTAPTRVAGEDVAALGAVSGSVGEVASTGWPVTACPLVTVGAADSSAADPDGDYAQGSSSGPVQEMPPLFDVSPAVNT